MTENMNLHDSEFFTNDNNKDTYYKSFIRKVDKIKIPTCNILGVNVAAINMLWLVEYLNKNITDLSGDYLCVTNVHTIVTSYEDPEYCAVQNGGVMAIPDGGPLSYVGRKRGCVHMERTPGPDLMREIFKISSEMGYRHYFYGSTEETLEQLYQKLTEAYPGILIAGMYSPPFRPLLPEEDAAIVKIINDSNPTFVWIGLGAPKQEAWMAAHQGRIKGLMVGVGAGFDYFAEKLKRAPKWMQKNNLEWLYRLIQEPTRLLGRYYHTNIKFLQLIAKEKKSFKKAGQIEKFLT
jgi:N-acetylglucosaminyldiphosphoundecaprenol N-acetyl-beta-D-mannosaminyltransferase